MADREKVKQFPTKKMANAASAKSSKPSAAYVCRIEGAWFIGYHGDKSWSVEVDRQAANDPDFSQSSEDSL